jgi:hypothetical protein
MGIKVMDVHFDYNMLLAHNYMYSMKKISLLSFCTMKYPHEGKVVTIDQHTYYEPTYSCKQILSYLSMGEITPFLLLLMYPLAPLRTHHYSRDFTVLPHRTLTRYHLPCTQSLLNLSRSLDYLLAINIVIAFYLP